MEALLAKQLDSYQEKQGLVHQGVHGFKKGRGCNTAMLEVWEYVLRRTENGELVALDFLDVSAGFDTLVHLYILRKNVKKGKVLGLVVCDDLSWRDQIDKVAKSCTTKLSGLWRCTSVLNRDQRKTKAEGIVLSRLFYCLETTSTGLISNMERLQGVQDAAPAAR